MLVSYILQFFFALFLLRSDEASSAMFSFKKKVVPSSENRMSNAVLDRLDQVEQVAVMEAQRLTEEAGTQALETIQKTEQTARAKLLELEEAAKEEVAFQASTLEKAARDKLASIEQAAETKITKLVHRMLPFLKREAPRRYLLPEKISKRLLKVLISSVLFSALGNLSGQLKAGDIWEAEGGAKIHGLLELGAVVLLSVVIPDEDDYSTKGTLCLGSTIISVLFGRAAILHFSKQQEGGLFWLLFSSIIATIAATVVLNELWVVPPEKKQPKRTFVNAHVGFVTATLLLAIYGRIRSQRHGRNVDVNSGDRIKF